MKNAKEPHFDYAVKIAAHLQKMFNEDEAEEYFIDLQEVMETNTATELIHAISNIVPQMLYDRISGDKTDILGFNHIANRLIFQFAKSEDESKTTDQ